MNLQITADDQQVERLFRTLKSFHRNEINQQKALEAVESATPVQISLAEQELLNRGVMEENDLKEFCQLHLKSIEDRVQAIKANLAPGHPIHTLICEHEEIKSFLQQLEQLLDKLAESKLKREDKQELKEIAKQLLEAEKHHKREEEIIFPRLEEKGITGPQRIMIQDHDRYWPLKQELKRLTDNIDRNQSKIREVGEELVQGLRDHIFKENNLLYPTALDHLEDWEEIKKESDDIGYCCFTPEVSR